MKDRFQISIDNIVHYSNVIGTLPKNIHMTFTTTIDPLSAGLIIISFDLVLVISESNPSRKLGMLSKILFILIFVSDKFLHMISNS